MRSTIPSLGLAVVVLLPAASAPAAGWRVCSHPGGAIVTTSGEVEVASGAFRVIGPAARCTTVFAVARRVSTGWAARSDATPPDRVRHGGRTLACRHREHSGLLRFVCGGVYRFDMSRE